jgi:hypothetical protein
MRKYPSTGIHFMRLKDTVAIVTGGWRGIGRAIMNLPA